MEGYGVYWSIVEDLYINANALPTDYEGIAYDLRTDTDIVKSIINDFNLFVITNGEFGSLSIEKRLDQRNEKSEKARESAFKRWEKVSDDANAMRTQCDGNAIKERIEKKEKKENNIIDGNKLPEYKKCVEIYFNFYERMTGLKPSFEGAEGKNMKQLIGKLKKSTDKDIAEAFAALLERLPEFYKKRLDVKIINNNYDKIIAEIRTKSGASDQAFWEGAIELRKREREELNQDGQ